MSLQVVIGLCKRKETAALKSNRRFFGGMTICLLNDGFFSFAVVRQVQFVLVLTSCVCLILRQLSATNCIFERLV